MKNEQEDKWGVGNAAQAKAFAKVKVEGENMELIHGEFPHSRQDNSFYAWDKNGDIHEFSGHRMPFKIEIEEYNYMKRSNISGDEIRKGCKVKLFLNGVRIMDEFARSYENGFKIIQRFIDDMELFWDWFPHDVESVIGRTVGYREQLFKITSVIVSQAAIILETLDGQPRKRFLWEDDEEFDPTDTLKVSLTGEALTWYPKIEGQE